MVWNLLGSSGDIDQSHVGFLTLLRVLDMWIVSLWAVLRPWSRVVYGPGAIGENSRTMGRVNCLEIDDEFLNHWVELIPFYDVSGFRNGVGPSRSWNSRNAGWRYLCALVLFWISRGSGLTEAPRNWILWLGVLEPWTELALDYLNSPRFARAELPRFVSGWWDVRAGGPVYLNSTTL